MSEPKQILLFGDQTNPFDDGIRKLSQHKENPYLISFLERAFFALRSEVGNLSSSKRQQFPRFTSLLDLLARYRKSGNNPALEGALTAVHQIATFIGYYGEDSRLYPAVAETYISGLCTGLLAASAISSAKSISDLTPAGIEAVLVAFRTGLRTMDVRDRICKKSSGSNDWSVVIPQLNEKTAVAALQEYSQKKGLPSFSRPYVSAVNANSVTLSGPPQVLDQLIQSSPFNARKSFRVAIHSPYHASHLYTDSDISAILASSNTEVLKSYIPAIPIVSSTTGKTIKAETFGSLLKQALREILLEPFRFDKVLEAATIISKSFSSTAKLVPVATNVSTALSSGLRHAGSEVKVQDITTPAPEWNTLKTGRAEQSKLAIVGYSGRFPDAESKEAFWQLLYDGLDVHREVPPDRWDVRTHVDLTGKKKNTSQVPYGCFIPNPGHFDARFFNLSPKEASQSDPAQRLAILTAYEALEQAGIVPNRTPSSQRDRCGLFYGTTSDDWREVNSGQNVDTYFIPGGNRAFIPGRINYHFKWSGPSVSVDTACSSSLAAIHTAANALWRGEIDMAVAGGTNVLTNPDNHTGLDRGHFLSRTGNCKTFDDGADGYCRADSVASIVLKRLEDAEADGDPIQGVLVGACTNHSAESVSITRPDIGAQAFVFDKVLNTANIEPNEVSYIEMHGTGTQAGDAVEMSSCLATFAPDQNTRKSPLYLGSVKSNVGHAESASGVTALVKVLLMMKESMIPPHSGIKTKINHNFPTDLEKRDVHIAFKPTPWRRQGDKKRRAFLNNFSAAGGNTALLLEDAPIRTYEDTDERPLHNVAVSGRSLSSLQNNVKNLIKYVDKTRNVSLASLSYTTTARRIHHNYRIMVSGATLEDITKNLDTAINKGNIVPIPSVAHHIAFSFTGQGSQYTGMGKQLYDNFSHFREDLDQLDIIVKSQGFPSIMEAIQGNRETDISELSPVVVQLATTCLQIALARLWSAWGVNPSVIIGHSLGEYAALVIAGVLSDGDAIYLCGKRAELLVEKCTPGSHAMLAVKAAASRISPYLDGKSCEIACINAPEETVISGTAANVDMFAEDLNNAGIKATKLRVPFAFHSSQVDPILEEYEEAARGITFHKPTTPIVSPLLGEVITESGTFDAHYLARHCREAVNFLAGLDKAKEAHLLYDSDVSIEIGSHTVVSGMIKSTYGPKFTALPSLRRTEDTWKVLLGTFAQLYLNGVEVNYNEYQKDFSNNLEVLELPRYSWDLKNHWIQYVHDWCLTKGDPPSTHANTLGSSAAPAQHSLHTTSIHRVIEEAGDKDTARIVVESDMAEPALNAVLQGHKVNGTALTSSSLWADIALTLGHYFLDKYQPDGHNNAVDVANMSVPKPLIADKDGKTQLFRASATVDWSNSAGAVEIYAVDKNGKKTATHGECKLHFGDSSLWQSEWNRMAYLVRPALTRLHNDVESGNTNLMKRGMAYRVFSTMVEYSSAYKGFEDVILDSKELEGTAHVKFQTHDEEDDFFFSPYWIDSLGHLSGFVMNGNDAVDIRQTAYINHGWDSMRCVDPKAFTSTKTYQTYVKMQPYNDTTRIGDVYVFDDAKIVAVFGGIKFQGIPRRILDNVLPPQGVAARAPAAAAPKKQAAPAAKSPPKAAAKAAPEPQAAPIIDKAMTILAEEIGMSVGELNDATEFNDVGVDSLLSLTISGKFREELSVDVESSIFTECPSVGSLRQYLSKNHTAAASVAPSTPATPPDEDGFERAEESSATSVSATGDEDAVDETSTAIRNIIADEVGVSIAEIADDADFGELGMDSLMTLTISSRIRETLPKIEIGNEFFAENNTMSKVEDTLGLKPKAPVKATPAPAAKPQVIEEPATPPAVKSNSTTTPKASSILLRGNPKKASKTLWLFPDGSGSAYSYAPLPDINPDVVVYGLNCPFMKKPEDLTCSLEGLTPPYLAEIKRRQPSGPYSFGGWSAGGICAFDAAQNLISQGEKVDRLIFIDSPFPIGLEKLPPKLYDFFKSIGMFGSGEQGPPDWLIGHFLAFVDSLDKYRAKPFEGGKAPKAHFLWAEDGVLKTVKDGKVPEGYTNSEKDPREMRWLLEQRTDFGSNQWEGLVGGKENCRIERFESANHFSMMEEGKAERVARFVERSMGAA